MCSIKPSLGGQAQTSVPRRHHKNEMRVDAAVLRSAERECTRGGQAGPAHERSLHRHDLRRRAPWPRRPRVLIIADESPATSSAEVLIPANRSDLLSRRTIMAVTIAPAGDIPRLPVIARTATPDLRSPNPWGVAWGRNCAGYRARHTACRKPDTGQPHLYRTTHSAATKGSPVPSTPLAAAQARWRGWSGAQIYAALPIVR